MPWDHHGNQKKEADIAYFCAFCAIKSALGDKEYVKTNKSPIIARMFGIADIKNKEMKERCFLLLPPIGILTLVAVALVLNR